MEFGYYPGCSLSGTAKEFDKSLKAVLKVLDVNLLEIQNWSCCGASSAHVTNHLLSVALPVRNIIEAKKQGLNEIVAPCAACYNRLVSAQHEMKLDEKLRTKIEDLVEEKYQGSAEVYNLIQLFQKTGLEEIKSKKKADLSDIKVACYYGCLLVRPHSLANFDDAEDPVSMEEIVTATGAKPLDWNFKTECCGAAHSIAHKDIVLKLSKNILDDAIRNGADVIVTACPMCHSNLDMRQWSIVRSDKDFKSIPVLYLSQLIGLALGLNKKELGIDLHFISVDPVLAKVKEEAVA